MPRLMLTDLDAIIAGCGEVADEFACRWMDTENASTSEQLPLDDNFVRECELEISREQVLCSINCSKINKSVGPYSVPPIILLECSEALALVFETLFKNIMEFNYIPEKMKIGEIIPILKPGKNKNSFGSYRPLTLTSNITATFDRILLTHLEAEMAVSKVLSEDQYGFRRGRGCELMLMVLIQEKYCSIDKLEVVCYDMLLLDYSDAFGSIDHQLLEVKLNDAELSKPLIELIACDFKNRQQYVKIKMGGETATSGLFACTRGVIQGGLKSPTLFNLYVSELKQKVHNVNTKQYCDDTSIGGVVTSADSCVGIQEDVDMIVCWSSENSLCLNPAKTVHLRITRKRTASDQFEGYTISGKKITMEEDAKLLGMYIDSKLTFSRNTEQIVMKARKAWFTLWRVMDGIKLDIMVRLYCIYVVPILDYACLSWSPSRSQYDKLERVQKMVTRMVLRCNFQANRPTYIERLTTLNLESVWARYQCRKASFVFNHRKGNYYHLEALRDAVQYSYGRNGSLGILVRTRLKETDRAPVYNAVKVFNDMPRDIRNLTTGATFRSEARCYFNSEFKRMTNYGNFEVQD